MSPESDRMAAMKVVVTGGAGFVGSHRCDRLRDTGHEVTRLDDLFTGRRDDVDRLIGRPGFDLIGHDVVDPNLLEADRTYDLACPASSAHCQYAPIETVETDVLGVMNMLTLARIFDTYGPRTTVESHTSGLLPELARRRCPMHRRYVVALGELRRCRYKREAPRSGIRGLRRTREPGTLQCPQPGRG
jgi:nucleoside-diphosphate-sugar epimerase